MTNDLGGFDFIGKVDKKFLVKDDEIKKIWIIYFHKLFNESHIGQHCVDPIGSGQVRN